MGGYVAMYFAATFPGRVNKIITLGTKFLWDEAIAAEEVKMLDPEVILQKIPAFADELRKRHKPEDWKIILGKTKEMLIRMGIHSPLQMTHYHSIKNPCLLLTGDRDKTVSIGETLAVYKQLAEGQFGVIPMTPHAIEKTDINTLAYLIGHFCA
jgi:pimeloyl-ACP methyl ester carboxylesterase